MPLKHCYAVMSARPHHQYRTSNTPLITVAHQYAAPAHCHHHWHRNSRNSTHQQPPISPRPSSRRSPSTQRQRLINVTNTTNTEYHQPTVRSYHHHYATSHQYPRHVPIPFNNTGISRRHHLNTVWFRPCPRPRPPRQPIAAAARAGACASSIPPAHYHSTIPAIVTVSRHHQLRITPTVACAQ